MSDPLVLVLGLALVTAFLRASGPLFLGERALPAWAAPVISVLPAALITGLIVVQVVGPGDSITIDERLAGLAAAGAVLWWRRTAKITPILAAAVTVALLRLLL